MDKFEFTSKLFRRKKQYNLRSQKKLYGTSTPKAKADASVECNLSFDEEKIAIELRREQIPVKPTRPEEKRTSLEIVDISVEPSPSTEARPSPPSPDFQRAPCSRESVRVGLEEDNSKPVEIVGEKAEKEKETVTREKETTETALAAGGNQVPVNSTPSTGKSFTDHSFPAGGQQVPVINSSADIYKHFFRSVPLEEQLRETEGTSSEKDSSDCEIPLSEDNKGSPPPDTKRTSTRNYSGTINSMFSQDTSEEAAARLLQSYQRTLNNLAQKLLIKDVNINKFRGRDNEDISRWFEKLELLLESKGIDKSGTLARAQIINNLSGPAETCLFELPAEERESYEQLKCALMKPYSTKDRVWEKRQRLFNRHQCSNELLSDYIDEMH